MPELPEVETVVRTLRPRLAGRRLAGPPQVHPRCARTDAASFAKVRDQTVQAVGRLGKFVRIALSDGRALVAHLGMTGRLSVAPPDRPLDKHTYMRLGLGGPDQPAELRYVNPRWCMGGLWLLAGPGDPADPTAGLGPDPLRVTAEQFVRLLDRRRQIKALLLDQSVLAGMGNIYCDEALFQAGIGPKAIAARLSRPRRLRLHEAMRDRLGEAIRRGGSSIRDYRDAEGRPGWFQLALRVYGRTGQPCTQCGRPIRHAVVAGRSTHFCPHCQPR